MPRIVIWKAKKNLTWYVNTVAKRSVSIVYYFSVHFMCLDSRLILKIFFLFCYLFENSVYNKSPWQKAHRHLSSRFFKELVHIDDIHAHWKITVDIYIHVYIQRKNNNGSNALKNNYLWILKCCLWMRIELRIIESAFCYI